MSDTGPAPLARLRSLVRTFSSALLGYSGGVDSACLAVVLRQELGRDRMLAVIGRSASYPAAQWEVARRVAAQFDLPLLEIDTHELDDPDYRANPTNRCFFCKRELWARLTAEARGAELGRSRRPLSLEPGRLRAHDHPVAPRAGGGGRGVPARPRCSGRLAGAP